MHWPCCHNCTLEESAQKKGTYRSSLHGRQESVRSTLAFQACFKNAMTNFVQPGHNVGQYSRCTGSNTPLTALSQRSLFAICGMLDLEFFIFNNRISNLGKMNLRAYSIIIFDPYHRWNKQCGFMRRLQNWTNLFLVIIAISKQQHVALHIDFSYQSTEICVTYFKFPVILIYIMSGQLQLSQE